MRKWCVLLAVLMVTVSLAGFAFNPDVTDVSVISDEARELGIKAVEEIDRFLDGKSAAATAQLRIKECLEALEELEEYGKDANVKSAVFRLKSALPSQYVTGENEEVILKWRNELANYVGEDNRKASKADSSSSLETRDVVYVGMGIIIIGLLAVILLHLKKKKNAE